MVWRQREDDLCRSGLETVLFLVRFHSAKQAQEVGQHDPVSQLALGVDAVNFSALLGDGSEWNHVVKIPAQALLLVVDVSDEGIHILLASLVERNNNQLRATRTVAGVHGLVVLVDFS